MALWRRFSAGHTRDVDGGWRTAGFGGLLLASLELTKGVQVHGNLGVQRDRGARVTSGLANVALAWAPHDSALLFAEVLASNRGDINGGTVRSIGARWWLARDVFGLDWTLARPLGGATVWGLGLGWYGLGSK